MTGIEISTQTTRESWLEAAINAFRARFDEVGFPLPEKIHVSVGFGYGAKQESTIIRGQCWSRAASVDGVNHMFISPGLGDTAQVLLTLLHECIHAALDCEDGHKGRFAEIATRLGFEGKMTSSQASMDLAMDLVVMAGELGTYPHGELLVTTPTRVTVDPQGNPVEIKTHSGPKTQTTRYHKVVCPVDGYTVRMTARWIEFGLPTCPCGTEMEAQ